MRLINFSFVKTVFVLLLLAFSFQVYSDDNDVKIVTVDKLGKCKDIKTFGENGLVCFSDNVRSKAYQIFSFQKYDTALLKGKSVDLYFPVRNAIRELETDRYIYRLTYDAKFNYALYILDVQSMDTVVLRGKTDLTKIHHFTLQAVGDYLYVLGAKKKDHYLWILNTKTGEQKLDLIKPVVEKAHFKYLTIQRDTVSKEVYFVTSEYLRDYGFTTRFHAYKGFEKIVESYMFKAEEERYPVSITVRKDENGSYILWGGFDLNDKTDRSIGHYIMKIKDDSIVFSKQKAYYEYDDSLLIASKKLDSKQMSKSEKIKNEKKYSRFSFNAYKAIENNGKYILLGEKLEKIITSTYVGNRYMGNRYMGNDYMGNDYMRSRYERIPTTDNSEPDSLKHNKYCSFLFMYEYDKDGNLLSEISDTSDVVVRNQDFFYSPYIFGCIYPRMSINSKGDFIEIIYPSYKYFYDVTFDKKKERKAKLHKVSKFDDFKFGENVKYWYGDYYLFYEKYDDELNYLKSIDNADDCNSILVKVKCPYPQKNFTRKECFKN